MNIEMNHMRAGLIFLVIVAALSSCKTDDGPADYREFEYNFHNGTDDWIAMFSDYPQGEEDFYELEYKWTKLPEPLDTAVRVVKISGNNHSDDLFSYIYKPVTGLIPNTTYQVTFTLFLASNIATNSVGIGGSPDLALGVGGLDTIPANILDASNYYRPNFTVELQSARSNEVMQVAGTLGVTDTTTVYTRITRTNADHPFNLTTNANGECYVLVGWDSGFEGKTTIYIKSIMISMEYWKN
jgi:hypothetical protein